jgi:hypothetical protein
MVSPFPLGLAISRPRIPLDFISPKFWRRDERCEGFGVVTGAIGQSQNASAKVGKRDVRFRLCDGENTVKGLELLSLTLESAL